MSAGILNLVDYITTFIHSDEKYSNLLSTFSYALSCLSSHTQRKKYPYSELFWSAFSRIRTEYGEILRISPYSVRMRENADRITPNTSNFHTVIVCSIRNSTTPWLIILTLHFQFKRWASKHCAASEFHARYQMETCQNYLRNYISYHPPCWDMLLRSILRYG